VTVSVRFVVLKFGGTSVDSREDWETIEAAARAVLEQGQRPVLVCSALSGVTNQLERLLSATLTGTQKPVLDELMARHVAMAEELAVELPQDARDRLAELEKLLLGAQLTGELTPRVRAKAMAVGELLSTSLGAAFLSKRGLNARWADARDHLVSGVGERTPAAFLSAACEAEPDEGLVADFGGDGVDVVVTQGFIARHPKSADTVLLGRGGSDTSAAYFAAKLSAARCEIWTDVPGVYTASPRDVPQARLLRALDYDEAQEIATMGAKVLHPRCLLPVKKRAIPLHIRCTQRPDVSGTVISQTSTSDARVKSISAKSGVMLVSMTTLGMWQQVGFLADAFAAFKNHGVSVDLVSTSEANVTVSFDLSSHSLEQDELDALIDELNTICNAELIGPCAAISLVGRRIRAILHKLGPALKVFEEQRIHLVSQAASDLNLTFVCDEDQAERLVRRLHALIFDDEEKNDVVLGPTWAELFGDEEEAVAAAHFVDTWWNQQKDALLDIAQAGTPAYVYDRTTLSDGAQSLTALKSIDRVFFAIKANPHVEILRLFEGLGLGFECVSQGELEHVFDNLDGLAPDRVLFTPNFAPREEYVAAFERGVRVNVDNLEAIRQWPDVFRGQHVLLRLDPGRGRGHHAYVRTAGAQSKFGIAPEELAVAADLLRKHDVTVVGLHAHAGSGIRQPDSWQQTARFLHQARERFPDVRALDLGGGLGVVEKPGQSPLDLEALDASLSAVKSAHPDVELWLEPGRFLVSTAGVLLAQVTQTKQKGHVSYVGLDAGMHTLIRPALYGAYHEIVNLSRLEAPSDEVAHVVGPICETGDTLGYRRRLPRSEAGDVFLIATAGAYGQAMSSRYNLRGPAREILFQG
jgi:diaminopimelate decarboxylase/aspartate kinase